MLNSKKGSLLTKILTAILVLAILSMGAITAFAAPAAELSPASPADEHVHTIKPSVLTVSPAENAPKELDRAVLSEEEHQAMIENGLLPRAGATCAKCGLGEYIVETDKRVSPTRRVSCVHYARGNDEITTTYYFTVVTCNTCGYSYENEREEEKVVCKGFS